MRANHIRLKPDRLNVPLETCAVGRYSSAVFVIEGDIPRDITGLSVEIERTVDPVTHQPRANFTKESVRSEREGYQCYLGPFFFPDASEDLKYHIMGTDSEGNSRWLGTGKLRVKECPCGASPVPPPTGAHGVFLESEVIGGVQHYKRQEIRYDAEMGAWGAEWTGDYIYTPGGFVPAEAEGNR